MTAPPDPLLALAQRQIALGQGAAALAILDRIGATAPGNPDIPALAALAWAGLGDATEARRAAARALALRPDHGAALGVLALAGPRAWALRAHWTWPGDPDRAHPAAAALVQRGAPDDAARVLARALALAPSSRDLWANLANARHAAARVDEALRAHARAARVGPETAPLVYNHGNSLVRAGRVAAGVALLERAARLSPEDAAIAINLGDALATAGRLGAARSVLAACLVRAPALTEAWVNLGCVDAAMGAVTLGCARFRRALVVDPGSAAAARNLMANVGFDPDADLAEQWRIARDFAARHRPSGSPHRHDPPADGPGPLRVGYLSSDFRDHPITRNILPVLRAHDRAVVTPIGYDAGGRADAMTDVVRASLADWAPVAGLSDAGIAARIAEDRIDILVILAGRLDRNRPLVAALRPAPVQISYLDIATSAVPEIDYLMSDAVLIPRGGPETYSERIIRLPHYQVFDAMADAPDPGPPPRLALGHPTFGSFNNPNKINDAVLALWRRALEAVPEARLRLRYRNLYADPGLRRRVMTALGPAAERLIFDTGPVSDLAGHLALYRGVDIALDTFPFSGSTTTFEALSMGVPVITRPGATCVSRLAATTLRSVGLTETIAADADHYVDLARRLAADPGRLARLRQALPGQVARSPLCDGGAQARRIERVYRALWRRWRDQARAR